MTGATKEHETVGTPERRLYQVRLNRPLFYGDPASPKTDKLNNLWAAPGEYVEASHPVLRQIIRGQEHKVRRLQEGEVIPKGSIFHEDIRSPQIRTQIAKYDKSIGDAAPVTAEALVVGADGGVAPKLSEDITKTDEVADAAETETSTDPEEESQEKDEQE